MPVPYLKSFEGMNRHHFAVFIHNCRLVVLLRQETIAGETSINLQPAEWRWTLPEVCNGKWHHYTISVDRPQIRLYIDGRQFVESKNNPEILNDWPLRAADDVHFMKLTIGGCWQGAKHRMGHYFRGDITGLTVLKNQTDTDQVMQCLNSCQEKLDLAALDDMDTGMSVSMNADMNAITIVGLVVESAEKLIRNIGYINSRMSPTPGYRSVNIKTNVQCADPAEELKIKDVNITVMVRPAKPVTMTLSGTTTLDRDFNVLTKGEYIFKDLVIVAATVSSVDDDDDDSGDETSSAGKIINDADLNIGYLVESCAVAVEPRIDSNVERFVFPLDGLKEFELELASTENGFIVAGADKVSSYQQLLRLVQYINLRPQDLKHRVFSLTCTEVNQHIISNPLIVNLEVVHKAPARMGAPHAMLVNKASHSSMMDTQRLSAKPFPNSLKYDAQETGIGVAVVMVVCIGFVIMLIVLGIVRVRNAQKSADQEEQERGEWDKSGLTITVNPMDPDNAYEEDDVNEPGCHHDEDCSDSEDDDIMYRNGRMDSVGGTTVPAASTAVCARQMRGSQLKWDKTTLAL